jgi:toxin ParE1/3/4
MRLIWSKEALNKLVEMEDYIAEDHIENAIRFIDFLISQSLLIVDNPKMGRVVPEFSDPNIRELIIKGYRIVYLIKDVRIEILTVFEGHRLIRRNEIFREQE